ncbi:hypothetical protein GCM10022284_41060 [Streptomyces hundungensis]
MVGGGRARLVAQFPAPPKPDFVRGPWGPFAQFPAPLKAWCGAASSLSAVMGVPLALEALGEIEDERPQSANGVRGGAPGGGVTPS